MIRRINLLNRCKCTRLNTKRMNSYGHIDKSMSLPLVERTSMFNRKVQSDIESLKKIAVDPYLLPKKEKDDLEEYLLTVEMTIPPNKFKLNSNDTSYLCLYTKPLTIDCEIGEYVCKEFQTVQDAENYYLALKKRSNNKDYEDTRNGIIVNVPVFVPQIFHKIFIENQLRGLLVNVKIDH